MNSPVRIFDYQIVSQSSSIIDDDDDGESNQTKSRERSLSYSGNIDSSSLFNMIIFNLKIKYLEFKSTIREQRFYDEFVRMLISVVCLLCLVAFMTTTQMFSDKWFEEHAYRIQTGITPLEDINIFATDPLYDRILLSFPDWSSERSWLPDFCLGTYIYTSIIFTILFPGGNPCKYQGIISFRRLGWIISILYLFRMASFLSTTVPSPIHGCIPHYAQNPIKYLHLMGRMAAGKISACTDNIFSGHTTLCVGWLYINWSNSGRPWLNIWYTCHCLLIILMILACRLHYTVDVLIAIFLTTFVFIIYHLLLFVACQIKLQSIQDEKQKQNERELNDLGLGNEESDNFEEKKSFIVNNIKSEINDYDEFSSINVERLIYLRLSIFKVVRLFAWMDGMDIRHPNFLIDNSKKNGK